MGNSLFVVRIRIWRNAEQKRASKQASVVAS